MEKYFRNGNGGRNPVGRGKRRLALLLSVCLVGTMIPLSARAENGSTGIVVCGHHPDHTVDCGYVEAVEGQVCEHTHDESCGYQEAGDCTHVHTEECGENGESCTHVHDDVCGYAEGQACGHTHDENCGYGESIEGSPCTFVCDTCGETAEPEEDSLSEAALALQARIDALPDAADITEENMEAVSGMLDEIDTARDALPDEEREGLDFSKYDAAAARILELMGQAGAGNVAVMALSGIDFKSKGKPSDTTVRTINLNTAVLRPENTWSIGGNMVYFGQYGSNAMKYRVLSSPSTQIDSENYLLLDYETILERAYFDEDHNTWKGSDLEEWLHNNFYENGSVFSTLEKTAIAETMLSKQNEYIAGRNSYKYSDCDAKDHVFCLSAAEADGLYEDNNARRKAKDPEGNNRIYNWWLRSASNEYYVEPPAGCVGEYGNIFHYGIRSWGAAVSPAFNVKLSSVLFASVSGADIKASALALVSDATATDTLWKLTLLDDSKKVEVTSGQSVTRMENRGSTTITVPYTYTDSNTANPVSQISVMITDEAYGTDSAKVLYYGALQNAAIKDGGTSGTGTFTLPTDLAGKSCGTDYYAYIIAEDVNEAQETDYASAPARITLPASKYTVTVTNGTLSDGNTSGDYAQGEKVTITADAAPGGQRFKEWEVVNGNVTLASSTSETTTFIMPVEAVSVQANYEAIPVTAPSITTQPDSVTVKEGGTATFTIAASGDHLTYQWQMDRNDGNGWVDIAGANAASYTASTVDKSSNGFQYRCVVSNSAGTIESNIVTLTVQGAGGSGQPGGGTDNPGSTANPGSTTNPGGGSSDHSGNGGSDNKAAPDKPNTAYRIIDGANSSWMAGSSEGLTIRGNGEFFKFTGVKVDGKLLDQSNYTAKEGSTIVTLKASCLSTFSAGSHTVEILWTDGSVRTTFTVSADTTGNEESSSLDNRLLSGGKGEKDDVPKTGKDIPMVWLFVLPLLSGAGLLLTGKKGYRLWEALFRKGKH